MYNTKTGGGGGGEEELGNEAIPQPVLGVNASYFSFTKGGYLDAILDCWNEVM